MLRDCRGVRSASAFSTSSDNSTCMTGKCRTPFFSVEIQRLMQRELVPALSCPFVSFDSERSIKRFRAERQVELKKSRVMERSA